MKKALIDKLRYIQNHPTTGLPHNEQIIYTQVETIFVVDSLKKEIVALRKTVIRLNNQNLELEKTNYKLQIAMLVLAVTATMFTIYQVLNPLISSLKPPPYSADTYANNGLFQSIMDFAIANWPLTAELLTIFISSLVAWLGIKIIIKYGFKTKNYG